MAFLVTGGMVAGVLPRRRRGGLLVMARRRPAVVRGRRLMRSSGFRVRHGGRGLLRRSLLLFRSCLLGCFLGGLFRGLLGRLLHGLLRRFFRGLLCGFFRRLLGGLLCGENLFRFLRLLAFLLLRFIHVVLLLR